MKLQRDFGKADVRPECLEWVRVGVYKLLCESYRYPLTKIADVTVTAFQAAGGYHFRASWVYSYRTTIEAEKFSPSSEACFDDESVRNALIQALAFRLANDPMVRQ